MLILLLSVITSSTEIGTIGTPCRTRWCTVLMTNLPPVSLSRELLPESPKTSWSPWNLPHDYFVVFLLISVSTNTNFGLRLAFFVFLYGRQVAGGEAYSTYLSLATKESAVYQMWTNWLGLVLRKLFISRLVTCDFTVRSCIFTLKYS